MMARRALLAAAMLVAGGCGGSTAANPSPDSSVGTSNDAGSDSAVTMDEAGPADMGATADRSIPPPDGDGTVADAPAGGLDMATGLDVNLPGPDVPVGGTPRKLVWQKEASGPNFARGMGGTSATDVWVGDTAGDVWHTTGNGQWTHRDINTAADIYGFWGSGPDNVYAAAYINRLWRWNGSGWQQIDFDGGVVFRGIWGSGPNDVYAVGSGIFHNRGDGMWRLEPDGQSSTMVGVWGSGPNDIWVLLGSSGDIGGILHSTGDGKWVQQRGGAMLSPGLAVWGSGPRDIYVLRGVEVLHSTGDGKWVPQPIALPGNEALRCICGSGASDVFVGTDTGRMLRSVGDGRWQPERFLPVDGRIITIQQCWAASNGEVFAVTGDGTYHGRPTQ
jgi:hypothetical protein